MILAKRLKLEVNQEQHTILLDTLLKYKVCVNTVFDYGFENKCTSGSKLHFATYENLRKQLPDFPSALVCAARERAKESLKAIKTRLRFKCEKPKTKAFPAIRYNGTCCSIGKDTFKLTTTQGRISIPIIKNPYLKEDITKLQRSCELLYKKSSNEWYLVVFVNVEEQPQLPEKAILGIDRGVKHLAVCSNNYFFNSKHLHNVKNKYSYLRKQLASKGTKSSKRLLRKLSGKDNRFQKDVNHCISKKIVNMPFETFVLEDLQIRKEKKNGKKFNRLLCSWSWKQFETFLTYKATLNGKKVVKVDARYTSQKCSVCGHIERGNRVSQGIFRCKKCGFELNADLNASRNIRQNYVASQGISLGSRVPSITPTSQALSS
jgi:IS605 OrfB family transposase